MSRQGSEHAFMAEAIQIHHASEPEGAQGTDPADITEQSVKAKRTVKPTQKLRENYEATRDEFSSNLSDLWDRTSHCMSVLANFNDQPAELRDSVNRLCAAYERYQRLSVKYSAFLQDSNIEDSSAELTRTNALNQQRDLEVQKAKHKAELRISHLLETRSHRSTSTKRTAPSSRSSRSRKSTLSDKLIEARADAEAKEAQSSFIRKQAEVIRKQTEEEARRVAKQAEEEACRVAKQAEVIRKQAEEEARRVAKQAEADSQIKILQMEGEKAASLARLKVLEQAMGQSTNLDCLIPAELQDPAERTSEYVLKHNICKDTESPPAPPANNTVLTLNTETSQHYMPEPLQVYNTVTSTPANNNVTFADNLHLKPPPAQALETDPQLNAHATSFYPGKPHPTSPENFHNQGVPQVTWVPKSEKSELNDFARYMIRRELINTSLSRFDDCAENYRAWRSTFKAAIADLNLTAKEELDLIIKWLGPESSDRVKRLRTVHVDNPDAGLYAAWARLEQTYGSSEAIESALFKRLQNFPKIAIRDHRKLQDLSDLLMELELAKRDPRLPGLSFLDTAYGVNPVVAKLPNSLQEKWAQQGSKYKRDYDVSFPPFTYFCRFISDQAWMRNDPSFSFIEYDVPASSSSSRYDNTAPKRRDFNKAISVKRTDISPSATSPREEGVYDKDKDPNRQCPIHKKPHPLKKCRGLRAKTLQERREILQKLGICFKCCASYSHLAKDCKNPVKCTECNSDKHVTAMHPTPLPDKLQQPPTSSPASSHGGEQQSHAPAKDNVLSSCTEVCGEGLDHRCCAKVCLVKVYPKDHPEKAAKMYAIIDEQSNRSLVKPKFFEIFDIEGHPTPYTLRTCSGRVETFGRRVNGFMVSHIKGGEGIPLPTLVECDQIPDEREEIPTPEVAYHHPHLRHLVDEIPAMDMNAEILVLLGRDILRVHKVRDQCDGPDNAPYAQRLDLGWVIVGDVCLDRKHTSSEICCFKTGILGNGRASHFKRCPHHYEVKEKPLDTIQVRQATSVLSYDNLGAAVFSTTSDDNKIALSIEDKEFIKIMDKEFFQDESNSWVAPLPFRAARAKLHTNREQALSRLNSLQRTLKNRPEMKDHFITFMKRIFNNDHAEPAPPLQSYEECWYLPFFGVYHPRKPKQIRVVFDSSAKHQGVSLNDVLLTGPNLTNNLVGVLMRFRREPVAITADIEQMFHCFIVREDHRNFLRFLWHRDNNMDNEIIEYRMKVHVFGNSPSPAVATYGLRRTALHGEEEYGSDARHFVERDFYVDDGLKSLPTDEEAIDLLKRTQGMLSEANLRLHKIASNSVAVMKAFQSDDHATGFKDLNLGMDMPLEQRSLGLRWNLSEDTFGFQVSSTDKPFTKRGVLSVVNSLYDPMGFVAPITIQGKSLLRQFSETIKDWDAPLPSDKLSKWESWKQSLRDLDGIRIPRCYIPASITTSQRKELHIFSDASTEAIAAITGPEMLLNQPEETTADVFSILEPDKDPEIRPEVKTLVTQTKQRLVLDCRRFERFYKWIQLVRTITKQVQHLANCFWHRWKMEYLSTLQGRRKWKHPNPNIKVGDLVLLKDQQAERLEWPMGLIIKSVPSDDGKVRKVEVKVARQGTIKTFIRPITELILLLPFGQ